MSKRKIFLTKEFYNIKVTNNKIDTNRYLNSYNEILNQIFKKIGKYKYLLFYKSSVKI